MSGDSQLPEATRTAIERYHLEGCRVRNWLQSAQNMDWSQNDRIPSISELIQASQLVRDTGLDVPRDVILSARTSYLERKEVDGWYKDQARRGFGTAGAQLEEHQYFTGQWKILLDNLSAGLKSVPIPTLADDAIRDASPTINPFTVVSGFESLALADSHPLTTPRGVALPTSDEPPRKDFTTLEKESKLRRTTRDYIFSAGMLYQSWQAFVNSPENRLFNAWISTLGVERAVLGAWSELDSGKRLTSGFDHIVRLFTEDSQRPYNGFLVDSKESFEVDRADGASQEASVQVNVDKIGARLQQIIARTAIWKEIVAAIRPKSSDNSDDNFLDYLDRIQRQISIQKVKYAPADEMGKTVALLSEVIKWSSPKAKPPLEARGARLPPYYLPKLFVMRAFQRAIGLISQSVIVISETALVADLYLLSMKSYGTTSFDKQATGDASDTKEVVLASKYAREIYAAVTLTLEVSDRQVYKGIANFWDNLKSFHSDLLILSSTGNVRIPKPLTNSPPAVAHIFVMLNARCIEFADTLWNAYQVIPSFLHLYNALQRMGLIKRIAIVEMVLKYALMVGAKGLFGGQPPKNNFRIHYDNMPFVHELLRHPGAKKGDKVDVTKIHGQGIKANGISSRLTRYSQRQLNLPRRTYRSWKSQSLPSTTSTAHKYGIAHFSTKA